MRFFFFASLALINGFICTTCITVSNAINIFLEDILFIFFPYHEIFSLSQFLFYFISCKSTHKAERIEGEKNLFTLILFIKYRERNCKAIELIHITLTLYRLCCAVLLPMNKEMRALDGRFLFLFFWLHVSNGFFFKKNWNFQF